MINHKIQKIFIKISQGIWLDSVETIISICRASLVSIIYKVRLQSVGTGLRLRGARYILVGENVIIGRFNWIEAVIKYGNKIYNPKITIGNHVALSDFVHISSVSEIVIGDGTLIGSKVYIGDHNHGFGSDQLPNMRQSPRYANLTSVEKTIIGKNCWIGDGAVILAGSEIADGSVVGANSVVKIKTNRPALVAGVPARIVKYY